VARELTGYVDDASLRHLNSEVAIHLHSSSLESLYGAQHGGELSSLEQIYRALSSQVAIATVNPDIDALWLIDIAKPLDNIGKLQQTVSLCARRPMGTSSPVLDLTLPDSGYGRNLSCRQGSFTQIFNDARVIPRLHKGTRGHRYLLRPK
jgi:hypothetical protein